MYVLVSYSSPEGLKSGQAGISRFFKTMPGGSFEVRNVLWKNMVPQHILGTKLAHFAAMLS